MIQSNSDRFQEPETASVEDALTEVLRAGARDLLRVAVDAEVSDLLAQYEGPTVKVLAEVVNVESPVISIQDDILNSSSAEGNQWYLDGNIIPGAVDQTYLPTESGFYTVEVTIDGCTAISPDVEYLITGISGLEKSKAVKIFPNPASGVINIE